MARESLGSGWEAANPFCLHQLLLKLVGAAGVLSYCEADRRTEWTKLKLGSLGALTTVQSIFLNKCSSDHKTLQKSWWFLFTQWWIFRGPYPLYRDWGYSLECLLIRDPTLHFQVWPHQCCLGWQVCPIQDVIAFTCFLILTMVMQCPSTRADLRVNWKNKWEHLGGCGRYSMLYMSGSYSDII